MRIDWTLADDGAGGRHLTFLWEEHGAPAVAMPTRRGFGTRLLARTFAEENGGKAEVQDDASGLIHPPLSIREEGLVLNLSAGAGA